MKRIATLAIAAAALGVAGAQTVTRNSPRPRPGEFASNRAWAAGAQAVEALTGRAASPSGALLSIIEMRGRRRWAAWVPAQRVGFEVDATTGRLASFRNAGRLDDQFRNRGRTGKVRFATRAEWAVHLLGEARRAGLPPGLRVANLKVVGDGIRKDANSGGSVNAWIVDGRGTKVASIECDPQDGELLVYEDWRK